MSAAVSLVRNLLRETVDFALPPRCPACGTITPEPHRFCFDCWQSLTFLGDPCCQCCGLPFAYGDLGSLCGGCLAEPPPFERLRAAVAYGEVARTVVLKLKYSGRPGLAETLARFMHRHLPEIGRPAAGEKGPLLVPVPLHRWRLWKRGYNQAALLASALARANGIAFAPDLLRRTRATPPLKGLGRRERALTVRGAFRVTEKGKAALAGRPVILVDDVFTTGATAGACARTLKRAGAASVAILCWARVVRESAD
ncbi:MAG TPA: ComF family protein [Allosphingosinicella sp.]|jgi:ComF family protein|nr:ComF family protein [Allosphingosinicella sp.]